MVTDKAKRMAEAVIIMGRDHPEEKAKIDAAAVAALDAARRDEYPEEAFVAGMNAIRGMCPDGCCGGVQEDEHPTPYELARHEYVAVLIVRGLAKLGG